MEITTPLPPTRFAEPQDAADAVAPAPLAFPAGHAVGLVFAHPGLAAQQAAYMRGPAPGHRDSLLLPARQAGESLPAKQAGGHFPARQAGGHFPAKQAGGHFPAKQAGGHFPAKQAGGGAPPAALAAARHALDTENFEAAAGLLRARLGAAPGDVAAMHMLAEACIGQGQYDEAERLLEGALALAPGFFAAREEYARLLFGIGKVAQAVPHLERLLAHDPRNANYRNVMATALTVVGDFDRAITLYEDFLREAPKQAGLWLRYGNALKHAGRRAESVRAYRTCLELAPGKGEAYFCLANLKTEALTAADIAAMLDLVARADVSEVDRFHLHYALGHALEQSGDFAGSFAHYDAGARLRRAQFSYDADAHTARIRRACDVFTPAFFAAREGVGCTDPAPVFIVGLPRAGTTLVEQILASHSAIEGTIEMPEIASIARGLGNTADDDADSAYPESLAGLDAGEVAALGARFIERSRVYRKTGKPFFIDKMPVNWPHIGLIHLMLPRARIIDVRRHPMASCFAAFKQYFAAGMKFSYDLEDLGRYYNDYMAFMAHFDHVLPGRIYHVSYEALVENTEAEVRHLLDYCGVPFEPACLNFWETRRAVGTASAEQVRQPIFREGLHQWRNFEPWLGALGAALETPN